MSPFIIYIIVLTVAYILYYTAIVTLDLNSKPKTEGEVEETFDTSDMGEENDGETSDDIAEAEEETIIGHSEVEQQADEEEPSPAEEEKMPSENLQELFGDACHKANETQEQEETETEETEAEEESAVDEEVIEGVSTIAFVEDEPFVLKERKEDDNGPAFDPNINEPPYEVSQIYEEPEQDTSVSRNIRTMNNALEIIRTKGNQFDSMMIRDTLLSDDETKKQNIAVRHEVTRT